MGEFLEAESIMVVTLKFGFLFASIYLSWNLFSCKVTTMIIILCSDFDITLVDFALNGFI